jgi:hypothetical protein
MKVSLDGPKKGPRPIEHRKFVGRALLGGRFWIESTKAALDRFGLTLTIRTTSANRVERSHDR